MNHPDALGRVGALRLGPLAVWPPVIQAPMAGFTNSVYRQMVRQFGGAGLLFTEMVSARGCQWLDDRGEEPARLWGIREEPRPLGVQIWDNDPATLASVGRRLAHDWGVSVVDINFGCPVHRVANRAQSGSYLLRQPARIGAIVARVVRACAPIPVTAKIRLGRDRHEITAVAVAKAVEQAGAAALTVHGRTAADFFKGEADWDRIAEIKSHLKHLPLVGNGDIDSPQKALDAFERYGVDAIMIGRAGLGRPWLFRQVQAALEGRPIPPAPTPDQERAWLLDHYARIVQRFDVEKGTMLMRKYACCYAKGRPGARHFRTHVAKVRSPQEFHEVVRKYFPTTRA